MKTFILILVLCVPCMAQYRGFSATKVISGGGGGGSAFVNPDATLALEDPGAEIVFDQTTENAHFLNIINESSASVSGALLVLGANNVTKIIFADESGSSQGELWKDNGTGEFILFNPTEALRITTQNNIIMASRAEVSDPASTTKALMIHNGTGGTDAPANSVLLKASDQSSVSKLYAVDENAQQYALIPNPDDLTVNSPTTTFAIPQTGVQTIVNLGGTADIETITGGIAGQVLVIVLQDEDISFSLNGGANGLLINPVTFSGNLPDTLVLMFDGTNWVEISRKNIGL